MGLFQNGCGDSEQRGQIDIDEEGRHKCATHGATSDVLIIQHLHIVPATLSASVVVGNNSVADVHDHSKITRRNAARFAGSIASTQGVPTVDVIDILELWT